MSKQISTQIQTISHSEGKQIALQELEAEPGLNLEEEMNLDKYIGSVPVDKRTVEEIAVWSTQQRETKRENTRTNLAISVVKIFGASLVACFVMMALAAFNPEVDKGLIKDLIPQIITPQVTLLGVALGFYFRTENK